MRIGIYPGTFDPVTLGHIDIIKKSLVIVDKIIVAIPNVNSKSIFFSLEERLNFIKLSTIDLGDKVIIKPFDGLLVDFAKSENCKIIIRGLRVVSDFEYEFKLNWINQKLSNEINTIFLPASTETHFLSSTLVKSVALLGGDLENFIPACILKTVSERVKNNSK